ncbi:MAG TPA: LL-diaminopimelate aminotransferase [Candidatus Xenobia bacterium]|jgi:LL-diaminopimelate aminotransferase
MKLSQRLSTIPPYLFAEIDRVKADAIRRGVDVISLGIGDPDLPTPQPIIDRLKTACENPRYHQYPPYEGTAEFRQAVCRYYGKRFGVTLDPDTEALALIGSKEGIAHIFLALSDPGTVALIPDPGYPVYRVGTLLAGGTPYSFPLYPDKHWLPNLADIPADVAHQATLMFLNYPNNPTGGHATLEFFEEAVAFCRKYDIALCHDAAYEQMSFDGYSCPSVLQVPGAKDVAIEFNSLSKPYNMTGWRIGYAVGNAQLVKALGTIKNNVDSGAFGAVQEAGIWALDHGDTIIHGIREVYRKRRDKVVAALRGMGFEVTAPKASFYMFLRVPNGFTSASWATHLLQETGIVVTPGNGYGERGEGWFRLSLTTPDHRLDLALERLSKLDLKRVAAV